jgi:hypothetical protein
MEETGVPGENHQHQDIATPWNTLSTSALQYIPSPSQIYNILYNAIIKT